MLWGGRRGGGLATLHHIWRPSAHSSVEHSSEHSSVAFKRHGLVLKSNNPTEGEDKIGNALLLKHSKTSSVTSASCLGVQVQVAIAEPWKDMNGEESACVFCS